VSAYVVISGTVDGSYRSSSGTLKIQVDKESDGWKVCDIDASSVS
jgi:hypothetical protein